MTVTIGRRKLLTALGAAAAWPRAARAQQAGGKRRIGVLMNIMSDDPESQIRLAAFAQGLQQLGWIVGQNVSIDTRWGAGNLENLRKYSAELVALGPDVIMANSSAAVSHILDATHAYRSCSQRSQTRSAQAMSKAWPILAAISRALSTSNMP